MDRYSEGVAFIVAAELNAKIAALQNLVNAQAEDEGLWFQAPTASEAYLQQALRELHALIEGDR